MARTAHRLPILGYNAAYAPSVDELTGVLAGALPYYVATTLRRSLHAERIRAHRDSTALCYRGHLGILS